MGAETVRRSDRARQLTVTAAEIFCVVGTLVGVGVLGTEVDQTSGGALAADATLLAPAGPAFSIWSVVYAGLAVYTVWQWLPSRAADPRVRATGWLAAASMVLNAGWLLVTQQGWIWSSVVVILALLATLVELVRRLTRRARVLLGPKGPNTPAPEGPFTGKPSPAGTAPYGTPARDVVERVVLDGTFGLYLGWVSVAVCANLFAAATESGAAPGPEVAVAVLLLVAGVGALFAVRLGARVSVALALAWGLGWVAVGRLTDAPASTLTGVVAAGAAAVVLVAVVVVRLAPTAAGSPAPAPAPPARRGR